MGLHMPGKECDEHARWKGGDCYWRAREAPWPEAQQVQSIDKTVNMTGSVQSYLTYTMTHILLALGLIEILYSLSALIMGDL
jgi:hypothetical protein